MNFVNAKTAVKKPIDECCILQKVGSTIKRNIPAWAAAAAAPAAAPAATPDAEDAAALVAACNAYGDKERMIRR